MEAATDSFLAEFHNWIPEEHPLRNLDPFLAEFSNWVTAEEEQAQYDDSFLTQYINLLPDELRWKIFKLHYDSKCFYPFGIALGPSWLNKCSRRQLNRFLRTFNGRIFARKRFA